MDARMWVDMFSLSLPVLEKVLRAVIVYLILIAALRLGGKRELAQLTPFDLVVLLTLSNTVQNAIIGDDTSVTGGVIGAATLIGVNFLSAKFLYRHQKLERIVEGKAEVLLEKGKVDQELLDREAITVSEVETAARKQGLASLEECEKAVLEPDGTISIIPKKRAGEEEKYGELLARIEALNRELAGLRAAAEEEKKRR